VQLVGYHTERPATDGEDGRDPALLVADDGALTRTTLAPGVDLAYPLGDRHCAGSIRDDTHRPCTRDGAPYCDYHTSRWPCARCTGDCDMPIEACHEEHAIYLAAFAPDTFKVGVTRSWRLETRLLEQGADRAAHVHTVADGRAARRLEAEYATDLPDRVRVPAKLRGLHRDVDEAAWKRLLADFDVQERFAFDYGLSLDAAPVPETFATGTVVGVQGRVLVLERDGTTYGVDLRDLVGHEVTEDADAERDRQSSLGAF
jgi:hypothetical protein